MSLGSPRALSSERKKKKKKKKKRFVGYISVREVYQMAKVAGEEPKGALNI
jgi:hypothetical protein